MNSTQKFMMGRVVKTQAVNEAVEHAEILAALARHVCGDWGDVSEHDYQANEAALLDQSRLFSVYHSQDGLKFWIITESDRSSTTVLLPEEY